MVAAERAGAPRASFEAALRVRLSVGSSVGKLSQFRADEIKSRLIAAGVVSERIHAIGLSQSRLVVPNTTPDNKARDRRVEITVDRPKP